ncbi:uncharacterized protein LOC122252301 isoform X2 [Penaeus japonicus]|uniref:uncharacterized protein LOC122252301 isoform X2 n=1 Tax=Penaeus japonicus TaxID=27405 RepID=UPI001C714BDE|nr:uncharacterized protein LOC122252301 isoform X2 [Penaeus japonicus]
MTGRRLTLLPQGLRYPQGGAVQPPASPISTPGVEAFLGRSSLARVSALTPCFFLTLKALFFLMLASSQGVKAVVGVATNPSVAVLVAQDIRFGRDHNFRPQQNHVSSRTYHSPASSSPPRPLSHETPSKQTGIIAVPNAVTRNPAEMWSTSHRTGAQASAGGGPSTSSSLPAPEPHPRGQTPFVASRQEWGEGGPLASPQTRSLVRELDSGEDCAPCHYAMYKYPLGKSYDIRDKFVISSDRLEAPRQTFIDSEGYRGKTSAGINPHSRLNSNHLGEVVKFGPKGLHGGDRPNIWPSQSGQKSQSLQEENLWPFLPGTQAFGNNRDKIKLNLDSDETREDAREELHIKAAVASNFYHYTDAKTSRKSRQRKAPSELIYARDMRRDSRVNESPRYPALTSPTLTKKHHSPEDDESTSRNRNRNGDFLVEFGLGQIDEEDEDSPWNNDIGQGEGGVLDNDNDDRKDETSEEKLQARDRDSLQSGLRNEGGFRPRDSLVSGGERTTRFKEEKHPLVTDYGSINFGRSLRYRRERTAEQRDVTMVEGGLAALPCDISRDDPQDAVQLILWMKEGIITPIYSYDHRELQAGRPKQTKPDANTTLARRTTFRADTSPAALLIERVDADDGGIYRCRVDYLLSPTQNKKVNLTVIVPPSRARVAWHLGNSGMMPVENGVAGPFQEATQPVLTCSNDDGWPPPAVVWYEGDKVLDDNFEVDMNGATVENELRLGSLTRSDLGRRLTCIAANTNKTQPATTTITISMTLGIVSVRVDEVPPVWAGERAEVQCKVWGSRPPPTVVWWLGSVMLSPTHTKVMEDSNMTVSILHFTPQPQDDGAMLICQATNEKLPDQAVQDSRLLTVNYAPLVDVQLGRSLDPLRIKEGDDVYFECTVKAKPSIFKVEWKHNGVKLETGVGVFVSNMSLVVQRVTRAHGGDYTCEATNVKGTSSSPPLHLDVKYAPVCATQQKMQHSVAKMENAEISCKVHANPPNVTFRWTFNNTAEAIDVPEGRFGVVGTESRVNYTPMNELDYGTLLCWANNSIGIQSQPCVFHIVAAGKPDPPHNCRVFDVTISSLQVTCLAGDDGGLTQNFLLQVYQIGSSSPVVEVTRPSPSFSVANLRPANAYKIIVAAINDKGASQETELKAYTVKIPERQEETSAEPTRDRGRGTSVPLAVMVGGGLAAVPVVVVAAVLIWLRVCRRATGNAGSEDGSDDGRDRRPSNHSKDGGSTDLASEVTQADERNPDIISHTPDPTECIETCGDIATISTTSSFYLPNGGPKYPSAVATAPVASSATAVVTPAPVTGGLMEYPQIVCTEPSLSHVPVHPHAHTAGHTAIIPRPHTHSPPCGTNVVTSQVPYFPEGQQTQVMDVPLPPPLSYNQGYQPSEHDYQPASSQCYSTLERKRHQQGCAQQQGFQHTNGFQAEALHYEASQQPAFPHLYQTPTGSYSQTPHGSQYSLSQYQGALGQGHPPMGSPSQSHQGTLRRGSSKKGPKTEPPPLASVAAAPPMTSSGHHHHHHHQCDIHGPQGTLGSESSGTLSGTLRRNRREGEGRPEPRSPGDGVELSGEKSSAPTPSAGRKNKRESAV